MDALSGTKPRRVRDDAREFLTRPRWRIRELWAAVLNVDDAVMVQHARAVIAEHDALVGRQNAAARADQVDALNRLAEPDLLSPREGPGLIVENGSLADLTVLANGDDEPIEVLHENSLDDLVIGGRCAPEDARGVTKWERHGTGRHEKQLLDGC